MVANRLPPWRRWRWMPLFVVGPCCGSLCSARLDVYFASRVWRLPRFQAANPMHSLSQGNRWLLHNHQTSNLPRSHSSKSSSSNFSNPSKAISPAIQQLQRPVANNPNAAPAQAAHPLDPEINFARQRMADDGAEYPGLQLHLYEARNG